MYIFRAAELMEIGSRSRWKEPEFQPLLLDPVGNDPADEAQQISVQNAIEGAYTECFRIVNSWAASSKTWQGK